VRAGFADAPSCKREIRIVESNDIYLLKESTAMIETDWNKLNPINMWRDWIVKSEQQWSETMSKMLKDERTGGVLSKQIDEARMMHRQFSEMAQMSLAAANLPSRTDLEMLDERMGRLEDGLAAVSAELAQLRSALVKSGAAQSGGGARNGSLPARPARNRKPVAAKPASKLHGRA
jgi:hypothetical protein